MIRKVLLIIGLTVVIVLVVIAFSLLLILQGTCVTKPRAASLHLNNDSALSAKTAPIRSAVNFSKFADKTLNGSGTFGQFFYEIKVDFSPSSGERRLGSDGESHDESVSCCRVRAEWITSHLFGRRRVHAVGPVRPGSDTLAMGQLFSGTCENPLWSVTISSHFHRFPLLLSLVIRLCLPRNQLNNQLTRFGNLRYLGEQLRRLRETPNVSIVL